MRATGSKHIYVVRESGVPSVRGNAEQLTFYVFGPGAAVFNSTLRVNLRGAG